MTGKVILIGLWPTNSFGQPVLDMIAENDISLHLQEPEPCARCRVPISEAQCAMSCGDKTRT